MVAAPLRRRAAAAALALFCMCFLSTCDFLTADIFPSWFSYVEARVDLRSIMKANGLGELSTLEAVEWAPFVYLGTDYSKVLVFAVGNGSNRVLLLSDSLKLQHVVPFNTFFGRTLASAVGGFVCGERNISPLDYSVSGPPPDWVSPESAKIFREGIAPTGLNYVVDQLSSNQARFQEYDLDWTLIPGHDNPRLFDGPGNSYYCLDADLVNGYSVLAQVQSQEYGFATSFPSSADFWAAGSVFDFNAMWTTGPFRISDGQAWLTSGGPVAFVRGDRDTDRLVRYRWGTGGFTTWFDWGTAVEAEVVDSIPFDSDDEVRVLSFDASGTWWFAYDRRTGYLYKLRTWWK